MEITSQTVQAKFNVVELSVKVKAGLYATALITFTKDELGITDYQIFDVLFNKHNEYKQKVTDFINSNINLKYLNELVWPTNPNTPTA